MNSFTFTFGLHCVTKSVHPKLLSLRVPCDCFWAAFGVHFGCFLGVQRLPKTLWKACLYFSAFSIVFGLIWGTFFSSGLVCRAKTFASGAVSSLVKPSEGVRGRFWKDFGCLMRCFLDLFWERFDSSCQTDRYLPRWGNVLPGFTPCSTPLSNMLQTRLFISWKMRLLPCLVNGFCRQDKPPRQHCAIAAVHFSLDLESVADSISNAFVGVVEAADVR